MPFKLTGIELRIFRMGICCFLEDQLTNGHEIESPGNVYVQPPSLRANHSRQSSATSTGAGNRSHIPCELMFFEENYGIF